MNTERLTPNPKCTRCKCYWKPDETDIKSSGLYCLTCKKCRGKKQDYKEQKKNGEQITCVNGKEDVLDVRILLNIIIENPDVFNVNLNSAKIKK